MNKKIQYQPIQHRGQSRILIKFEFNKTWIDRLRKTTDARWSKTLKAWHISDTEENRKKCKLQPQVAAPTNKIYEKDTNKVIYKEKIIDPINAHILPNLKQHLILKAYSPSTHKTYINEVSVFLQHIGTRNADTLTAINIKAYLQYCLEKLNLSENTIHSRLNALKFYYEQVLKNDKLFWEIPRPKKHLQLPKQS
jgi:integrase/recombinase XerD